MVFVSLYESLLRNELLLIDGGICQYRIRKDNQVTIHVLISSKKGAGKEMLTRLIELAPNKIVAKCPKELASNAWYKRNGFSLTEESERINTWTLFLSVAHSD